MRNWRSASESEHKSHDHPIVFDNLKSLSDSAMVAEGVDLLVAGSDTTATSLTVTVWEILSHPWMEERLVKELDAVMPDKSQLLPIQELEKLEYLVSLGFPTVLLTTKDETDRGDLLSAR